MKKLYFENGETQQKKKKTMEISTRQGCRRFFGD